MILVSCGCSNSAHRSSSQIDPSNSNPPVNPSSDTPNPPVKSSSDTPNPTVPPVSSSSEEPSTSAEQKSYTITWKNYDDSILEIDYNVPEGTMPSYDYETPRHPCDPHYAAKYYIFSGWTPTVVPATKDATYVATFTESNTPAHIYRITWKNYDGTTFYTSTCGEGATPEYAGDTPRKPSSGGKYYAFDGWDPTPVPAYSDATYTAKFIETTPPEPAVWPTNVVNAAVTAWGAQENSFPPFEDERITSFTASLNSAGDTLKIACNGMSLNEGKAVFSNYVSSKLGSFTPDTTLVSGQTVYIDPTNHFYIGYDNNYPSIFRLMAVKMAPSFFTVTWKDYNGDVLRVDENVAKGTMPDYGYLEPSRPDSEDKEYYFSGWDKALAPVTADVTYTAQYYESIFIMDLEYDDGWQCRGLVNKNHAGAVTVPSTFFDGQPVTRIGDNAFENHKNITKLVIPNSVIKIGEQAFAGMTSLQELEVPFVGETISATGADAIFGYFFGTSSISGTYAAHQYYAGINYITSYIPSSLTKVTINGGVINRSAFEEVSSVSTVILNEGVTEIKEQGFYKSSITAMVVPNSVTKIGGSAFSLCYNLTSFYASNDLANDKVMEIGWSIFDGCRSLTTLSIPMYGYLGTLFGTTERDGCTAVTQGSNTYYIPSSLTSVTATGGAICEKAFENTTLTDIAITNDVVTIAAEALAGANSLVNLSIPFVGIAPEATEPSFDTLFGAIFSNTTYGSSITYGAHQQYNSGNYKYSYIPLTLKNVTVTGGDLFDYAFSDVSKLDTITLSGAKSVGNRAFYNCSADVTLNEGLETLYDHAFYYSDMDVALVVPDSVKTIGESAFYSCDKIPSIVVGSNVESIGKNAFTRCTAATSITFRGNKLTKIEASTFNHCDALTKIVIPEGVTEIDSQAFDYCGALADVTLPSTLTDLKAASIFAHNEVLTTIKFNGTVAQWNAIQKASNWISSTCPNVTTIVCSDGNVSL